MAKIAFIYVPVLHEGYRLFLTENQPLDQLYLLDQNWLKLAFSELEYLRKDLRALPVEFVKSAIDSWQLADQILTVKTDADWPQLMAQDQVVLTNDDIGQVLAKKYFSGRSVIFSPIFLRWDRQAALDKKDIKPDSQISADEMQKHFMQKAFTAAGQSNDWWRHVGAVLVNDRGEVISFAANKHQPGSQTQYENGDVRSLFARGEFIEMSTSAHAESALIGAAARSGISTLGCTLYVTDFPCPYCARVIAESGIKQFFYSHGYSVLDGEDILKAAGILIGCVILEPDEERVAVTNSISRIY